MMYQLRTELGVVCTSTWCTHRERVSTFLHPPHPLRRRSAYKQLLQLLTSCIVTSGPLSFLIKSPVNYRLTGEKKRYIYICVFECLPSQVQIKHRIVSQRNITIYIFSNWICRTLRIVFKKNEHEIMSRKSLKSITCFYSRIFSNLFEFSLTVSVNKRLLSTGNRSLRYRRSKKNRREFGKARPSERDLSSVRLI